MGSQNSKKESAQEKSNKITKADAAKMVKRNVPVLDENNKPKLDKDQNPVTKGEAIKEEEVMSFAEYPDRVVVVTTSGEKLVAEK